MLLLQVQFCFGRSTNYFNKMYIYFQFYDVWASVHILYKMRIIVTFDDVQ